jgi:chromosome segregation ATPase
MEANVMLSIGSILGIVSLFYSWHKDSRQQHGEVSDLKARLVNLEKKAEVTDSLLQELLSKMQEIQVSLATISAKIDNLEKENNTKPPASQYRNIS